jgi:hypothetical protein
MTPCMKAAVVTSSLRDFNDLMSLFENNCDNDPNRTGKELSNPMCMLLAFRKTAKAAKKDSPKPIMDAANIPSNTEYLRLFFILLLFDIIIIRTKITRFQFHNP